MKTVEITLYTYAELGRDAQEKALEEFRDINTDYNWWEDDYDDFITICSTLGIRTSPCDIYFSGFGSQGDGSTFDSEIDVLEFIGRVEKLGWKSEFPQLELHLQPCPVDRRVLSLIKSGTIDVTMWTESTHHNYYVQFRSDTYIPYGTRRGFLRIETELEMLDTWVSGILDKLNGWLYSALEHSYEIRRSDESVAETIRINGYHFTKDGIHADWLLD